MFVQLHILDARGSLASLGSHPKDQLVVRTGPPPSPGSKKLAPEQILRAPILHQQAGIAVPGDVVDDLKHEFTKRATRRALDKHLVRINVTHQGKWLGIVFVRLLCLANGYVVERWMNIKPANGVEAGGLKVRIVMRDSMEDAITVFRQGQSVEPSEATRTEGCACVLCDPYSELVDPKDPYEKLSGKETFGRAALAVVAACTIS